jgi:hypothetical protein
MKITVQQLEKIIKEAISEYIGEPEGREPYDDFYDVMMHSGGSTYRIEAELKNLGWNVSPLVADILSAAYDTYVMRYDDSEVSQYEIESDVDSLVNDAVKQHRKEGRIV